MSDQTPNSTHEGREGTEGEMAVGTDTAAAEPTMPCPVCGKPARITEWNRPPRETTWDRMGQGVVGSWRTFEPGPTATVTLDCGDTIHGEAGLAYLLAASKERGSR